MRTPENAFDVFLQPGELYFGDRRTRIRTILGSCVSLVFWHPGMCVGGMCHFMLPSRGRPRNSTPLDGRYADEAVAILVREIDLLGTSRSEYQVKVFGGGDMFSEIKQGNSIRIGERNIAAARELLTGHGFKIATEHLGSTGHRNVVFEVWSGTVWVRHVEKSASVGQGQVVDATNLSRTAPIVRTGSY